MTEVFPIRLRAYDASGTLLGNINYPSEIEYHDRKEESPTLSVTLTSRQPSHNLYTSAAYIGMEIRFYGVDSSGQKIVYWAEPPNSRFFISKRELDRNDTTSTVHLTCVGVHGLLSNSSVGTASLDSERRRVFSSSTVGAILLPLISEARSRGGIPLLTTSFSAANDTNGAKWPNYISRSYEPSMSLKSVLEDLSTSGLADFQFKGNQLNAYIVDSNSRDLTSTSVTAKPVYIRDAWVQKSPDSYSIANKLTDSYVMHEGGTYKFYETTPSNPYGRMESYTMLSGNVGMEEYKTLAESVYRNGSLVEEDYTREYVYIDETATPFMPLRDYSVGDWIYIDTGTQKRVKYRVVETGLKLNNTGEVTAFVTAGSIRRDRLTRLNKAIKNAHAGANVSPGGPIRPIIPASAIKFDTQPTSATRGMKLNDSLGMAVYSGSDIPMFTATPGGTVTFGNGAITANKTTGNAEIDWSKTNAPPAGDPGIPSSVYGSQSPYRGGLMTSANSGKATLIYGENINTTINNSGRSNIWVDAIDGILLDNYYKYSNGTTGGAQLRVSAQYGFMYTKASSASPNVLFSLPTTTSTLNYVVSNTNGYLFTRSSLSKDKLDQKQFGDQKITDALLEIEPRSWVDRKMHEEDPEYTERSYGYIAEEVQKINEKYDNAISGALVYDEDGELASVGYTYLPSPTSMHLFKHLHERIKELEAKLENLSGLR